MPRKKKVEELENIEIIKENETSLNSVKEEIETPEDKTAPASFYGLDFRELDKDLSPDQLREWTSIYASYRSKSPLSGTVIGVDLHKRAAFFAG